LGAIAIALNGVSIYGGAVDNACTSIDVDSIMSEWNSFDCCGGHSQNSGDYHYHFPPSCLLAQAGDFSDGHSPQIGWSYDGFPIYGPKGPAGIDMMYCSPYGSATSSYCLDECGGVQQALTAVDQFLYRYYIVGATSDLQTLPGNPKPSADAAATLSDGSRSFTLNCRRGYTYTELTSGSTGTSGVSSSYSATATTGYTSVYAPAGICAGGSVTSEADATNGFCSTTALSSCNVAFVTPFAQTPAPPSTPAPPPTPAPPATPAPPNPAPTPIEGSPASASQGCAFPMVAVAALLFLLSQTAL
jgi:hypothetical protein